MAVTPEAAGASASKEAKKPTKLLPVEKKSQGQNYNLTNSCYEMQVYPSIHPCVSGV